MSHSQSLRRKIFSAIVVAFLAAGTVVFCLPGGAAAAWKRVFTFFGLRDFSACADGAPLSVHVLDVGKADSIVVECGGRFLLVDGGTADRGGDVAAYLRRRGASALDYVFCTHPDEDHIGGLRNVLQNFRVLHYCAPSLPPELVPGTEEYRGVQAALKEKKLAAETVSAGRAWRVGKLDIRALGPVKAGGSTNNNSIVLKLTYGSVCFLLTGDAEREEEQDLLSSGQDLSADVLKVAHHGSDTSSTREFLSAVKPKFAAVSVGEDSSGLPKRAALERLYGAGASVFRTDVSGTLIFMTDGHTVTVKTEK